MTASASTASTCCRRHAGAIRIDLANGRLSTDGPVWVVVGPLRLARLRPHWDLARSVLFSAQSPEHEAESEGDAKQKEEVPKERKLGGLLSVEGSIEMKWEPGKTVLKGTVRFPKTGVHQQGRRRGVVRGDQ